MSKNSSKASNENKQRMVFRAKFGKNGFWGWNFENLTLDLESALPGYHVCQFSSKMNNIDFFGPNLAKNEF